jgi:hypothetical protein
VSTGATFFWGCAGGFFAAGFVHVVPAVSQAKFAGGINATKSGVALMVFLIAFLTTAAGLVALIPDEVTRGQAIMVGFGSQTMIKGLITSVRDWFPPNSPTA